MFQGCLSPSEEKIQRQTEEKKGTSLLQRQPWRILNRWMMTAYRSPWVTETERKASIAAWENSSKNWIKRVSLIKYDQKMVTLEVCTWIGSFNQVLTRVLEFPWRPQTTTGTAPCSYYTGMATATEFNFYYVASCLSLSYLKDIKEKIFKNFHK